MRNKNQNQNWSKTLNLPLHHEGWMRFAYYTLFHCISWPHRPQLTTVIRYVLSSVCIKKGQSFLSSPPSSQQGRTHIFLHQNGFLVGLTRHNLQGFAWVDLPTIFRSMAWMWSLRLHIPKSSIPAGWCTRLGDGWPSFFWWVRQRLYLASSIPGVVVHSGG